MSWMRRAFNFQKQLRSIAVSPRCSHSKFVPDEPSLENDCPCHPIVEMWRKRLLAAEVPDVDTSLNAFVAHVLKLNKGKPDIRRLTFKENEMRQFEHLCETRLARMPLQHILGETQFMGMNLKITTSVFVPRLLTAEFVETILNHMEPEANTLLEVGCGTGAISLAILKRNLGVTGAALERCAVATSLAQENASRLGLKNRLAIYHHTVEPNNLMPKDLQTVGFDTIVSNPPYACAWEFEHLPPEVTMFENMNALCGGIDGLDVIRTVLALASRYLNKRGTLWLEVGPEHAPLVLCIVTDKYKDSLAYKNSYTDNTGHHRFVEIRKI